MISAFLIVHLQNAVEAGRLPGELACSFSSTLVGAGARNVNGPKELIFKMIELDPTFYHEVINVTDEEETNTSSDTKWFLF